jgi:hypothetical protein
MIAGSVGYFSPACPTGGQCTEAMNFINAALISAGFSSIRK